MGITMKAYAILNKNNNQLIDDTYGPCIWYSTLDIYHLLDENNEKVVEVEITIKEGECG